MQRVLSDPDNDLREMVEAFVSRGEPIWYIDRHVFFDVPDDAELAEEAAVELARLWATRRTELADRSDVSVSKPYAIVDDDWLAGDRETAPPHVYIVLARPGEVPSTGHEAAPPHEGATGNPTLDRLRALYGEKLVVRSIGVSPDSDESTWLLEPGAPMKRVYADFNDFAADGTLPLICRGSIDSIAALTEELRHGELVLLSDGELEVVAQVLSHSDGSWEARLNGPLREHPIDD